MAPKGYIKLWRSTKLTDFDMPDFQFKLWILLQLEAIHDKFGDLGPGELLANYPKLQRIMRRSDGKEPSTHTLRDALQGLQKAGYISVTRKAGLPTRVRILRWAEMQGDQEFQREPLPPEAESNF